METRLEIRLKELNQALLNFKESLELTPKDFTILVWDSIASGQIQKFEFCAELLWKTIQAFLSKQEAVNVQSPKQAIKEFLRTGHVSYEDYEALDDLLEDRNALSHIYRKEVFDKIHPKLKDRLGLMQRVFSLLQ